MYGVAALDASVFVHSLQMLYFWTFIFCSNFNKCRNMSGILQQQKKPLDTKDAVNNNVVAMQFSSIEDVEHWDKRNSWNNFKLTRLLRRG